HSGRARPVPGRHLQQGRPRPRHSGREPRADRAGCGDVPAELIACRQAGFRTARPCAGCCLWSAGWPCVPLGWRASPARDKGHGSIEVEPPSPAKAPGMSDRPLQEAKIIMSAGEAARSHLSNSFFSASLADSDPEIARAIGLELGRQRDEIELIASENIVSRAVLEAQ